MADTRSIDAGNWLRPIVYIFHPYNNYVRVLRSGRVELRPNLGDTPARLDLVWPAKAIREAALKEYVSALNELQPRFALRLRRGTRATLTHISRIADEYRARLRCKRRPWTRPRGRDRSASRSLFRHPRKSESRRKAATC